MNWNKIYDILVETCQAPEWTRGMFVADACAFREFRFQGALGFGGKLWKTWQQTESGWREVLSVTCYSEDSTPARRTMIALANERLREFWG